MNMPPGFYPFWFWNARLDPAEIRRQIALMAQQGVRGFYLCPRQGLEQPYLSESYFQMVDAAIAAAEEFGLQVHLYDEYPYPSGAAGGQVTLGRPEFYATSLTHQAYEVQGPNVRLALPQGHVLSVVAYPVRSGHVDWSAGVDLQPFVGLRQVAHSYAEGGLTPYNRKRFFSSRPTPILETTLPPGDYRVYASVQTVSSHHKYYGHFVDVLHPQAIAEFIGLTHDKYHQRYGQKFGRTIGSIFTDETSPHWSARIPQEFQRQYGYDLIPHLPALAEPAHPDHVKVSRDLHRLQYRLFCEAFEQPIAHWCRQKGIAYAGEKTSLRMSQLRFSDIPGCEPGHTRAGDPMDLLQPRVRGNARTTASAAYFYAKQGSLCECYHSLGWGATLQDAKLIAEGLLLMGIDYLVPHAFFYSTHGLAKHDAPPSYFFQMPFWPLWKHLSARVDRLASEFAGTHIDARVLVVEPTAGLPSPQQVRCYGQLLQRLMEEHIEFLCVDTDILEEAKMIAGHVRARDVQAAVIVVPAMRDIEPALQQQLDRFTQAGGRVVCVMADDSPDAAVAEVAALVKPSLAVPPQLQVVARRSADKRIWFVLNPTAQSVAIDLPADPPLHEISLDENLPPMWQADTGRYRRTLLPFESLLLMAGSSPDAPRPLPHVEAVLDQPLRFQPLHANVLRMYQWTMTLPGDAGQPPHSAQVPAMPLAHQLEKGGFRFRPAVQHFFGSEPELSWPAMDVRYEHPFRCDYDGPVQLVMEPGSIGGPWTIRINDGPPLAAADFAPTTAHVHGSLGVDITPRLRPGNNVIRVDVQASRAQDGLLNALYLAGDFGVDVQPWSIGPRPAIGDAEQPELNGLPHYAGIIQYTGTFQLRQPPAEDLVIVDLAWPVTFQDACEVSINGSPFMPVLWQPRRVKVAASQLQAGSNAIVIRVYTSMIRSFEGAPR